ncbi:TPA: 4-hydroxy-tetrahydrodipicolinate synthase [Candidatus Micrarchaeota archaeon]|nr:4-hydroxy-tetrahydrodipicolinate synthase [Candidatus Micrarchaeota archaeon]
MPLLLEGVLPPHVTPFTRDGEVDEEALRELVRFWLEEGVHGLVSCASNGEGPYLTRSERARVLKVVLEEVGGGRPVVAGVAAPSTREAIEQAKDAADVGADAVMLTPPFYYTPSQRELLAHYRAFLDKVDVPVVLYNVPKFVGYNVDPGVVATVVEEYSQVVGIKDSSGMVWRVSELVRLVGGRVSVMAGTGDLILPTLVMGGRGAIVGVAIVAPAMCVQLYEAFRSGDLPKARELQLKLTYLNEVLIKRFNQLSAVKEALRLLGKPGGYPRLPSLPLDEREREEVRKALVSVGLLEG